MYKKKFQLPMATPSTNAILSNNHGLSPIAHCPMPYFALCKKNVVYVPRV